MSVVEFMIHFDWHGDIRDAAIHNFATMIDNPPAGVHPGRWRGMVFWIITRLTLNDGIRF